MNFTYNELLNITGGEPIIESRTDKEYKISTDTRTIDKGDVYLPLKGETFDGELFIEKAIESGAEGYFTTNPTNVFESADFAILVQDTKEAYMKIAREYKRSVAPITIAITGSSGKTTTKEIFNAVFSPNRKTHKSQLNHNNEIGLCQTLLTMPEDTEVLIVEMGMRGLGEIEILSKYAEPDIAVITNIGTAHIGRLGSRENIAKAKCEIVKHLKRNGVLITGKDRLYKEALAEYEGKHIETTMEEPEFEATAMTKDYSEFIHKGSIFRIHAAGEYNVLDTLPAIEAARIIGLTDAEIQTGLETYRSIEKRFEETEACGLKIINDSYNANPDSVKAALKTFIELYDGDKTVVLGDMGELGEKAPFYHAEIGEYLNGYENLIVITVGTLSREISKHTIHESYHFKTNKEAAEYLKREIPRGSSIFLKGSRSMKLEEIIEEMKK